MQTENRIFDDFVKFVNGAAGTMAGATREAGDSVREHARSFIGGLDFVSREEFEAVKAMAAAARDENDALKTRLDALEAGTRPAPGTHAASGEQAGSDDKPATGPLPTF